MTLIVFGLFLHFYKKRQETFSLLLPSLSLSCFADNDTKGVQMNDIINLLGLEDETVKIIDVSIADGCKTITAEKILYDHYCPSCGCHMYSRALKSELSIILSFRTALKPS